MHVCNFNLMQWQNIWGYSSRTHSLHDAAIAKLFHFSTIKKVSKLSKSILQFTFLLFIALQIQKTKKALKKMLVSAPVVCGSAQKEKSGVLLLKRLFEFKQSGSTFDHLSHHQTGWWGSQSVIWPWKEKKEKKNMNKNNLNKSERRTRGICLLPL